MSVIFHFLLISTISWEYNWAQPNVSHKQEKLTLRRGKRLMSFQDYLGAIPYFQEALKYNPNNLKTHYYLAKCLVLAGQKKKALTYLETLIDSAEKIHEKDLPLLYAQTLHFTMQFDKAIEYYQKYLNQTKKWKADYRYTQRWIEQCKNGKILVNKPVKAQIRNLGKTVNTIYSESVPVITGDEKTLYFTTRRPSPQGMIAPDGKPYEDVYYTQRDSLNGEWQPPKSVGPPINTYFHDACVAISANGQTLFIYRDQYNGGIFISKLKGKNWTAPENIGPPIESKYYEPSACLSADERILFFVSDRPGGYGGQDIYYSIKNRDGKWSAPINLGPSINTPYNEDCPFFHYDNKTLYFSSEGHTSMGGYDIFKTTWRKDKTWSPPINLGYPINTPDDDAFFVISPSGKRGYYSSNKEDSFGDNDLYEILFEDSITLPPPALVISNTPTPIPPLPPQPFEAAPEPLVLLKGKIACAHTRKALEANIYIIEVEKNDTISILQSNAYSGEYLLTLPTGGIYNIAIEAQGYLFFSEHFQISENAPYQAIQKDFFLTPIEEASGKKIILKNIFFDFAKATLRKSSEPELNRLFNILNEYPQMRIRIIGHTDSIGSQAYNQKLSEERAKAVATYLIKKGISETRIEYLGLGESSPIATNSTEEGRQQNRRIEFEIIQLGNKKNKRP
ncbi:MAG: OmpA family protein [Bacteroidia bacterium]|nr:OmpA family protein [Bacteroidia bacterium]MDW8157937.1 OmpA family protein [Bacteroidia bacterium]